MDSLLFLVIGLMGFADECLLIEIQITVSNFTAFVTINDTGVEEQRVARLNRMACSIHQV